MAVIVNRNTQQTPITSGLTGTQVIRFIDAPRVYIKTVDSSPTPVIVKSDGATPTGYTDLGIVDGKVKITYSKDIAEIRTGLDQVLQQTYIKQKTANFEFTLSQFDDVVIQKLSGLSASTITAGSAVSFGMGAEDVVSAALLLVVQNKLDGKEAQFYCPSADLSFVIEDSGEATVVKGTGNLKLFTFAGVNQLFRFTMFA
jgi:hypothetical protein